MAEIDWLFILTFYGFFVLKGGLLSASRCFTVLKLGGKSQSCPIHRLGMLPQEYFAFRLSEIESG